MEKRKIIFGTYDTAVDGLWTLTGWSLSEPAYKSNFVAVPGRDGDLDLSTALTDGAPRYSNRTLTATFECSEGTRLEREDTINTMVNWLDGWRMDIILPDDDDHYITGRVRVKREYNDPSHAAVTVTAACDPWRYSDRETVVKLTATEAVQTAVLVNSGRKTVVPLLVIEGEGASIDLTFGTASWGLSAGTYQLPDLVLNQGSVSLTYKGTGDLTFTYREAVL